MKPVRNLKKHASPLSKEKAKQAKILLDNSRGEIPTIRKLAYEVSLNRVCLQQAFQELFGISIGAYGKRVKMECIKKLLLDYTQTLDSIAVETGFNSSPALSRFFKNLEGISPGVWRKIN